MAWAVLHPSSRGIASFVPPVHALLWFQLLQHCSESSKSPTSCSTDQKSMTHDLISFREHICLVLVMNSLVSTFGDGRPVRLCLWSWPVNSGDCRVKGTGQWKWSCYQTACGQLIHQYVAICYYRGLQNEREEAKGQRYRLHKLDYQQSILNINVAVG